MMLDLENIFLTIAALSPVFVAVITLLLAKQIWNSLRGPGPWGVPFFGYYPFLKKDFYLKLQNLAEKYGDAYFITIFGKRFLHLSSYEVMKEVYLVNHSCFVDRIDEYSILQFTFKNGVFMAKGEKWQIMRKFFIRSLRELRFGTPEQMKETVEATISTLNKNIGKPIDTITLFTTEFIKGIKHLAIGETVSDENLQKLQNAVRRIISHYSPWNDVSMLLIGNIARYLIAPWNKKLSGISASMKEFENIFNTILKERKSKLGLDDSEDIISLFLREKQKKKDQNDPQAQYFDDKTLIALMTQIYICGGLGIGLQMSAAVKKLAENRDIQDTMYKEIIREVGTERLPTYEDKIKLPYVKAVVKECLRTIMVVPAAVDRMCNRDTTIAGIYVPKGTRILVNYYALHHNPAVYKNAEHFDPTRFLDSTTTDENTKQRKDNSLMTFGIGKRACVADQMLPTALFLLLTALIQNFTLHLTNMEDSENLKKESKSSNAVECQIIALPRHSL